MSDTPSTHHAIWQARGLAVTWMPASFEPPSDLVSRVAGICFTEHRKIALVTSGDGRWNIPGGHLQSGETLRATLERAVWEEARVRIVRAQYIGCQQIEDPNVSIGPQLYYQACFWARIEAYPFKALFKTTDRLLVEPSAMLEKLFGGQAPSAKIMLDAARAVEGQNGSACID